jgi:DNA invertase Pin-like site-specific DNA recombinase
VWVAATTKRKPGWNVKRRPDDGRGKRTLSDDQIEMVRYLHGHGSSMRAIARIYETSHPTISRVLKRQGAYDVDAASFPAIRGDTAGGVECRTMSTSK